MSTTTLSAAVERMIATSESTVIIYDYEQTFSSVKRTHQVLMAMSCQGPVGGFTLFMGSGT